MAKAEGILALLGKPEDDEDEETDAAKDILAAVKSNDAKALSMALSRHYELCEAKHAEPDDDDEKEY